ncbi:DUF4845 domain-containing protein [Candidatus Thiothrix anitrata]|jgi:hypothetical protein|uniref:DUF4845 domain-containing protein n=1 Tax=Candidatus Thiothrix anitrata TaxID=2823902 RepID=A0ABX7X455_9GAMM|nr:DUF4845 domain-containing protein [Candidatus Thiothrix anitrata]QTR49588.1 DUF4845 domain-containing protein [Candidatus Thiothrix anitrata]
MHKQKGATFLSWMATASVIIFSLVTVVKLVPSYLEFRAVKSLVNDIAANPSMKNASKQQIISKVDDYLNINGLYTLTSDAFSIESVAGKKNVRELVVHYESRKNWLANIDFLTTFHYSVELGKAGDT